MRAVAVAGLLESWGCTVYSGSTALAAMAAHERHSDWDVILSDYRLADGDNGLLAIERLRAYAGRNVPACLMSGDTDSALMQAAKDANLPLLHKPVRPAKLRSLLRRLTTTADRKTQIRLDAVLARRGAVTAACRSDNGLGAVLYIKVPQNCCDM